MDLVLDLINFFGFDLIASAETFPELVQYIVYAFLGVLLVIVAMRSMFGLSVSLNRI